MIRFNSRRVAKLSRQRQSRRERWTIVESLAGKTTLGPASIRHDGVRRCLNAIARNPRLKLADLTKIVGLSSRGLHKAFLAHVGFNPGKILRLARLQSGCELLVMTQLALDEIAMCCGYQDSNGLCVAFRRDLGMTPSDLRNQHSQHLAAGKILSIPCAIYSKNRKSCLTVVLP